MTTHVQRIHLPLTSHGVLPVATIPDEARALLDLADEQMDRARAATAKAQVLRRAALLITTQANHNL